MLPKHDLHREGPDSHTATQMRETSRKTTGKSWLLRERESERENESSPETKLLTGYPVPRVSAPKHIDI